MSYYNKLPQYMYSNYKSKTGVKPRSITTYKSWSICASRSLFGSITMFNSKSGVSSSSRFGKKNKLSRGIE